MNPRVIPRSPECRYASRGCRGFSFANLNHAGMYIMCTSTPMEGL